MMSGFGHFRLAMAGQRRTVGRTVRDLQTSFSSSLESDLPLAMLECAKTVWRHLGPFWIFGTIILAFMTWACLQTGLNATASVPVYLMIVVLLSLMDSAILSAIFSIIVVPSLDYVFFAPIYSIKVRNSQQSHSLVCLSVHVARYRPSGVSAILARRNSGRLRPSISRTIRFLSAILATLSLAGIVAPRNFMERNGGGHGPSRAPASTGDVSDAD
jgi:hypothetical protein